MSGDHNAHQNDFKPDWDTVKAFDERHAEDTELLQQALDTLNEVTGWQWHGPKRVMDEVEDTIAALKERLK